MIAVMGNPEAPRGSDRQVALYTAGGPAAIPTDAMALRAKAQACLPAEAFTYADGGAGSGGTMIANRASLDRRVIRPRVARDISSADMGVSILGRDWAAPIMVAPIGGQEMAHPQADLATARACAATATPMVFSTQASVVMERTAPAMGDIPHWFQLYWSSSDALVESFVGRADACGCEAIVVTLDTPMLGWRPEDLDLRHLPFMAGKAIAHYVTDPVFRSLLARPPEEDMPAAIGLFVRIFANPAFDWGKIAMLRGMTRLPIVVKGITHPDDALLALDHGVDGIIVSNHGGRQIDGAIGAADALAEIAPVVSRRVPLLFDSGIRGGADIFRALALGASAVLIGRPVYNALAIDGEAGVRALLLNLIAEFDLTMRLAGCTTIAAIDRTMLALV